MKTVYNKIIQNIEWVLFFAATILGVILCISPNLTYDETYSFALAQLPVKEMVEITSHDVHPPLYYMVLRFFLNVTYFNTAQMAKVFSLLFYLGYLLLIIRFGEQRVGKKISRFWLFLSVFMPCMVVQMACVRMYTFALFWTTATAILLYDFYEKENSWQRNLLLIVCSLMAMYSHSFTMVGVFLMYAVMVAILLIRRNWKKLLTFFLVGIVVAAGYLPWLGALFWQASNRNNLIARYPFIKYVYILCTEWFSSEQSPSKIACCMGAVLFAVLLIICLVRSFREKKMLYLVAVLPFALLVLTGTIMSIVVEPCFFGRYAFCVIFGLFLAAAYGYEKFPQRCKPVAVVAVLCMCAVTYISEVRFEREDGLQEWEELCREYIEEDDLLLMPTVHGAVLDAPCDAMFYGTRPPFAPFTYIENFTEQSQLDAYEGKNIWWLAIGKFTPEWYGLEGEKKGEIFFQNISFALYEMEMSNSS